MNFEPQKFFVGLIDFFSILLPGALLTYLFMDEVGPVLLENHFRELAGPQGWIVFLVASYISGHLVFLIGAWLVEPYDVLRRHTSNRQIEILDCLLPLVAPRSGLAGVQTRAQSNCGSRHKDQEEAAWRMLSQNAFHCGNSHELIAKRKNAKESKPCLK